MTVEEFKIGQLYSFAEASINETGGGEGVEVIANEPYNDTEGTLGKGQYTHKIYHVASKVPSILRKLAPSGALEVQEKSWNAYPYCKTVITNPDYMKDKFHLTIETWHKPGRGELDNVHNLSPEDLLTRPVDIIDIANNDQVSSDDYNADWDPSKFQSLKTGRGPLVGPWQSQEPVMCAYKLVTCEFIWWGQQATIEKQIMMNERRLFSNFYRQVFCWIDSYLEMSMEDIRKLEAQTKKDLNELRATGEVRGMMVR